MKILGIDSTTKKLSVAVSEDNKLLFEIGSDSISKHMVNIMKYIDVSLAKSNLRLEDIDVFGVSLGPGDFTGTRIGISVVKILSWVENKVAFGINSLDVFSTVISFKNSNNILRKLEEGAKVIVAPCLDVKRNEIYFSFYEVFLEERGGESGYSSGVAFLEVGDKLVAKKLYIERLESYCLINKNRFTEEFRNTCQKYIIKDTDNNIRNSNLEVNPREDIKDTNTKLERLRLERLRGRLKIKSERLENGGRSRERSRKEPRITVIVGGNALVSYGDIFLEFGRIFQNYQNYLNIVFDRESFYPGAAFINMCSYFNALMGIKPGVLVPVYVRDFVPF